MFLYFDSICFNSNAGGVLQFSNSLLSGFYRTVPDQIKISSEEFKSQALNFAGKKFGRFVYEEICAGRAGKYRNLFFPNYYLPHSVSRARAAKSLVVIHDFQYKYFPNFFSKKKLTWLNWAIKRCHDNGCRENLEVVYNPIFMADIEDDANIKNNFDFPFLLTSAHYYPHKNFSGALDLYEGLVKEGYGGKLLITGGGKEFVTDEINKRNSFFKKNIRHMGYVDEFTLRRLQRNADALISLSNFEGFNLPAAECSKLGTKIILSNIPVHREIFKKAFIYKENTNIVDVLNYISDSGDGLCEWEFEKICNPMFAANKYFEILNGL